MNKPRHKSGTPPPLPNEPVVVYDCLSGNIHSLGGRPLVFGNEPDCEIQIGSAGFKEVRISIARSGARLNLSIAGGSPQIEVNGASFLGGLLPEEEECSLVIDNLAFFLIGTGADVGRWAEQLKAAPGSSWSLRIFESATVFEQWKQQGNPLDFTPSRAYNNHTILELIEESAKRSWDVQVGVVYHDFALAGFYASQLKKLSQPQRLPDAGVHRCPRCWMRFGSEHVLAIHPTNHGDEVLGESELQRFIPRKFAVDGAPLTPEGVACTRLACPHCRGELPPNLIHKAPHMLSIVGDSMAGKSYFLTVAVRQLKRLLPARLGINFTDADPVGNAALARMIAKLFTPSLKPEDAYLTKTELAGETYRKYQRHGESVQMPKPFTYNLVSKARGNCSIVLYDNAGEHFRPDFPEREKSNSTEHLAWASGILYLFDPLQHGELLRVIKDDVDPQVKLMKAAGSSLRFDQDVILAEIASRLSAWRQLTLGQNHDVPLALVLGKHDLLGDLFPMDRLNLEVYADDKLSMAAINENSELTRKFLIEYCPDIVGAAENISHKVKYFPVSAFGSAAIVLGDHTGKNGAMVGPDPKKMNPYLVEAPFLWLISEAEPSLFENV